MHQSSVMIMKKNLYQVFLFFLKSDKNNNEKQPRPYKIDWELKCGETEYIKLSQQTELNKTQTDILKTYKRF